MWRKERVWRRDAGRNKSSRIIYTIDTAQFVNQVLQLTSQFRQFYFERCILILKSCTHTHTHTHTHTENREGCRDK